MSLPNFLKQPLKACTTILTIGKPNKGKTYTALSVLENYWIPNNMFDMYFLVIPHIDDEQKDSYKFLKQLPKKGGKNYIFVYRTYDPEIVEKMLKINGGKNKKRLFFFMDDTTSQKSSIFRCPLLLKLVVESRHFNIHTWIITHYSKGIIEPSARKNVGYFFLHRVEHTLLDLIFADGWIDLADDFPDAQTFKSFMLDQYRNKEYPSVLFDRLNDRYNENCPEWPKILNNKGNKKS